MGQGASAVDLGRDIEAVAINLAKGAKEFIDLDKQLIHKIPPDQTGNVTLTAEDSTDSVNTPGKVARKGLRDLTAAALPLPDTWLPPGSVDFLRDLGLLPFVPPRSHIPKGPPPRQRKRARSVPPGLVGLLPPSAAGPKPPSGIGDRPHRTSKKFMIDINDFKKKLEERKVHEDQRDSAPESANPTLDHHDEFNKLHCKKPSHQNVSHNVPFAEGYTGTLREDQEPGFPGHDRDRSTTNVVSRVPLGMGETPGRVDVNQTGMGALGQGSVAQISHGPPAGHSQVALL